MIDTDNKIPQTSLAWQKIVATICFILLAVTLLVAYNHPAQGYELNIYSSTPAIIWVSIILSFLGGAGIILQQVISQGFKQSKIWLLGLSILILTRIVLLYIPYIRGYVSWSGDNIAYLGLVKDILITGHFTGENIYPITHVFLAAIIFITGISATTIANLSTAFVSVLFVLFIYLLVGTVTHDKRKQILAVLIAGSVMLTGIYNVMLAPNGWSILVLPLLLYLYFRCVDRSYRVLLIILLAMYPLFHPLSAFMVIIALVVIELTKWIFNGLLKRRGIATPPTGFSIIFIVVEFMIFSLWILSHQEFNININLLWHQITSGVGSGEVALLNTSLSKINVHGFDFLILLFKLYGEDIILIILSCIGIIGLLRQARKTIADAPALLPLATVFVICGLFYAGYLLGLPGFAVIGAGQWDRRFLGYVEVFIALFSAAFIYKLLSWVKSHSTQFIIVMALLAVCCTLSIFSLYFSPFVDQPNNQVTTMEITGVGWLFAQKNVTLGIGYIMSPPLNIEGGIAGYEVANDQYAISEDFQMSAHFGFPQYANLGDEFTTDKYMFITKLDQEIYSTVWKQVGSFTSGDFEKFDNDQSVSKIYTNSEANVYYIQASGQ